MTIDFNGFEAPNHTQTPNEFFDRVLPKIEYFSELKVILAIIRQTYGWHKKEDRISLSRLEKLTGMKRQVVFDGVKYALEHGYIERRQEGQNFYYRLKLVTPGDQSPQVTSNPGLLVPVTPTDQQLVTPGDPQKKEEKKLIKEKRGAAKAAPAPRQLDLRVKAPAIQACRDVLGKYPNKALWDMIISTVTDIEQWKKVMVEWVGKYDTTHNIKGMLDWYTDGIPQWVKPRKVANGATYPTPSRFTPIEQIKRERNSTRIYD